MWLVFVDGLGWGGEDPRVNPCRSYGGRFFDLPAQETGGAGDRTEPQEFAGGWVRPIDATLGVEGVPQSATGQTSLLTGQSAQGRLGKHLTGFPNEPLREMLLDGSILRRVKRAGRRSAFLNAYRPLFFQLPRETQLRLSATTIANLAAENRFFGLADVVRRRAIYQEFTNRELQEKGFEVPTFSPAEAGEVLAEQGLRHDFTLFEYFQTDRAGHSQDRCRVEAELTKLEEFLASLLDRLGLDGGGGSATSVGPEPLVILTSDHGNLEDLSTRRHTRNPVPLMAWGTGARRLVGQVENIAGVVPAVLSLLEG
jgi:hypothetical protein